MLYESIVMTVWGGFCLLRHVVMTTYTRKLQLWMLDAGTDLSIKTSSCVIVVNL